MERLRNEKRTLINDREERTELVEYVEEQREVERYRDRQQRKIDQARVLTRAKWALVGMPTDDPEEYPNSFSVVLRECQA